MIQSLWAILLCLILAYVLAEVFKKLGLPRAVGQLIAGLVLGIGIVKSAVFTQDSLKVLDFLASLGLILLFYYVGLQTNFKEFTKHIRKSLLVSLFNTAIPFILGFVITRFVLHWDLLASLIVSVSLSVSAQSVSVDILDELNLLKSKLGNLIVAAGAVDDFVELILITVLLAVFHSAVSNLTVAKLLLDVFVFVIILLVARLIFVPYTLKIFDIEKSSTSRFMVSIMLVLLMALLSDLLGIGMLAGAIAAGIIVRQTIYKDVGLPNWEQHDIAKSTHIIAFGFLIPLFFVKIGLSADLNFVLPNINLIILFVLIAIVGTVGGTIIAVLLDKGSFKEGLLLGWGLAPKGDVELAILSLALGYSIITQQMFTALVIMSLVTTIIAPSIFRILVAKHHHEFK